jgi:hypothetical protein
VSGSWLIFWELTEGKRITNITHTIIAKKIILILVFITFTPHNIVDNDPFTILP